MALYKCEVVFNILHVLTQEKDRELEVLKETTQRDSLELKMKSNSEINNAKQLAKIAEEKVMKLQVEIQHRDELNQDLRSAHRKLFFVKIVK